MAKVLPYPQQKYTISDGITQSMLSTFLTCREKSRLILNRFQALGADYYSFYRGDLIHSFLEEWYTLEPADKPNYTVTDVLDFCYEWLVKNNRLEETDELHAIYDTSLLLMEYYVKFWEERDSHFKWIALEKVFDVMWKGYRLRGKIDGIVEINGGIFIVETKSKAQIDEDGILDALAFDFQNLFYLTVLNECLGINARGVIYNIIRWPSLRKKKLDEDLPARIPHYYKRFQVSYTSSGVQRFKAELHSKLMDFDLWVAGTNPNYRNESACFKGNMKCEFLKLCSTNSLIGYKQDRTLFRELL